MKKISPKCTRVLKSASKTFINVMVMIFVSTNFAEAGVAADTLLGVGLPIVQLLVLGFFGWLVAYILQAFGHGQIAGMVKLMTVTSCIGIVVTTVWKVISSLAGFFGIQL